MLCQYLMRANEHAIRMSHCARLCLTALTMLHDHRNVNRLTSIVPRVRHDFSLFSVQGGLLHWRGDRERHYCDLTLHSKLLAVYASERLMRAVAATEKREDRLKRQQH